MLEELKTYGNLFTFLHGQVRLQMKGLAFGSDENRLTSCGLDSPPVTWDLKNRKNVKHNDTDNLPIGYPNQPTAIAISQER